MLHDEKWDLDEDGKVIWDVANYIEEHGWCQNLYNAGKNVCILGAYRALGHIIEMNHNIERHPPLKRIASFLGYINLPLDGIADYNDTKGRTKKEVILMLKQAAKTRSK